MRRSALNVVGLLTACMLVSRPALAQERPWVELTKKDLRAVREVILENHAGPVDPLNPGYKTWLDSGFTRSMAMADSVVGLDGLIAVVSQYTSGFQDGHLGWSSDFTRRDVRWPGIVLARRGSRYIVSHVADWVKNGPATGAEVLSCGGVLLDDRLNREVVAFDGGIRGLEASRTRLAPSLLVWDGNPWKTRPTACRIRAADGEREVPLQWRVTRVEELEPLQMAAAYGKTPTDFTISHPAARVTWVTVPSLAENVGDNKAGLESLVRQLPGERGAILIVFDVRGNRGGNSYWGRQLLSALFGNEYGERVATGVHAREYIQWRASKGNADFIERSTLPRFEKTSPDYVSLAALVDTMRLTLAAGKDLTGSSSSRNPGSAPTPPAHPLANKVVLLTDGWCASACLDFADLLLAIPGVRHAGAATYADAVYIDNRSIRLPSDLGWFGFSMKVYRDRPRGHNQPYVPTLVYDGVTWDTPTLQRWLIDVVR